MAPVLIALLLLQSDHAAAGRKALEADQYAEAAAHFESAVAADPKDWASRFHLGLALSLLGRDAGAASAYRKVLEEQPGLYEAELNLGIVLLRMKSPEEAVKLLASAASKKPKEYRPVFYYAEALAGTGDLGNADAQYRAALELNPKSAECAVGLARTLARQGRLNDADPFYRQAAQSDPEFRRALLELAAAYEKAREPEKAIRLYREFPEDVAARERMGELLLESGESAAALPELEKAFQQSPTAANRVALATAYLRTKQPAKALPLLEQAVAAEPENLDLRMFYGRALRDQRTYPAAAQQFWRVAQARPDSKEAWNELAGVLMLLENYPQALSALDRAAALGGEQVAHSYFRAIMLDRMKDYKAALASYQKFLSLSEGKHPDEEFKARQRIRVIQKELGRR
jgi:tetratricopeptide (TPR) repeat protein